LEAQIGMVWQARIGIVWQARKASPSPATIPTRWLTRLESPYVAEIPELKLPKEMLDLATYIVNTKSGHFDPGSIRKRPHRSTSEERGRQKVRARQ
jgi:hypothetical protein